MDRRKFLSLTAAVSAGGAAGFGSGSSLAESGRKKTLKGTVVLITGATSGIGEATAHAFAERGAKVVFCGRREKLGAAVEKSIRDNGGVATYVKADVRDEAQVKNLVNRCKELYGGLHIAYNNAGIAPAPKMTENLSTDEVMDVMQTNFFGVFYAMKYEIPMILESGGGSIVNCGSYSADHAGSGFTPYSASKHALIGLTKTTAIELAKSGINVNAINPYCVDTPMIRNRAKYLGVSLEEMAARRPSKKVSQPKDVAELVVFLTSKENRIIHGQTIDLSMGHNIMM